MADPNALYSYQGEEPQPLPHEISWNSGSGMIYRTNVETFTEEEIEKAGYTGPFERPEHDPRLEMMSWDSENMEWVKTQFEDHMFMAELRRQRYRILQDTDWTQMPDSPLTEEEKTKWANFRQALRDFSKNCPDPKNYSFPLPVDFEL
jgi:hypothetical protein